MPYPLSYKIRWPYYYLRPSTRNHTNILPKPLHFEFENGSNQDYVKLMICGDIMVRYGNKALILDKNLKILLEDTDLVIANCEAPVSDEISIKNFRFHVYSSFLMPAEYLQAVVNQVENDWLLSIANNHIADHGYEGLNKTKDSIELLGSTTSNEVSCIGTRNANPEIPLHIQNIGNLRLGVIAWTYWLNKENIFAQDQGVYRHSDIFKPEGQVLHNWSDVKKTKNLHTLIAFPHWGYEFQHFPDQSFVDQAEKLVESGIDGIVGSHPHVLQAMDWFDGKICLYGLGDFCSLIGRWPSKLRGILEIKISRNPENFGEIIGYELHPVVQDDKKNKLVLLRDYSGDLKRKLEKRLRVMYF